MGSNGNSKGNANGNSGRPGSASGQKPIAIYHEHPDWFRPLFEELDRRDVEWVRIDASQHQYDVSSREPEYSLLFNRMSPSAWLRGNGHGIFYTLNYLAHLEELGTRVVNGLRAFTIETSKALQLDLLESLGLPYPKARVINHPSQALVAAEYVGFPLVVKPNIGGSGAGVCRFDNLAELHNAIEAGTIDLGIDRTGLVQDYIPARGGIITRVEVLGGRFLYAIRIELSGEGYRIEVGGVEYVVDDRDGRLLYYDINALSNFVADAPRVVGFDPFARLADFLIAEASYEPIEKSLAAEAR